MKDENSIFGADSDRMDRLLLNILGEPDEQDPEVAGSSASLGAVLERHGGQIGRYKLLSVLGEGGMGVVHLAEQQRPIIRRVALKVIKPGMDSRRVIARFEAERQALALLDHPNIAHVYDAGTTENGRPYFVMEYVDGLPITEHCDRHQLTIEDRLGLFLLVCSAVHHAHQKGMIHRDIKPSNILVTGVDDRAVPKIIDFGIAKAVSGHLAAADLVTEQGQLVGTPEYMSPEQADGASADIDTRSDIYSLGVVLYQLLTGVLPFDSETLRERGVDHVRRVLSEQEPKTPSTRLSQLGKKAESVAQQRRTDVPALTRRLQRELEWIPLKALRKDRTRRYRSAAEFADDIENYLRGLPLIAGPESVTYRAGKFVRRYRIPVLALVAVAVVLILATGVSTAMFVKATRAEKSAQRNAYLSDMGRAAQAWETGDLLRARTLLERYLPQWSRLGGASFEWRLLWELVHEEKWFFGFRAGAEPNAVALSAQGRFLAWADKEGRVRIVEVEIERDFMLPETASGIHSLAFSANGQWLATGGDDGLITLWNVPTWTVEASLEGHGDRVTHLAFHSDEERLVSLGADEMIRIWDLTERAEVIAHQIPAEEKKNDRRLRVSADGRLLAAFGGLSNTVPFYGVEPNMPRLAELPGQKGIILAVEFAADAKFAIISTHDSSVARWDLDPLQDPLPSRMLYGQNIFVKEMTLSADGLTLATAGSDNLVKVWDVETGRELRVLRGHTATVSQLCLSADGSTLVSGDVDGWVKVWRTDPNAETNVLTHEGLIVYTAVAPEGDLLAATNSNFFAVDLWDLRSRTATRIINDAKAEVAFSPDGKWRALRTFSKPFKVELWDRSTSSDGKVKPLPCAFSIGYQLRFSPDSRILVFRAPGAPNAPNGLELWDIDAQRSLGQLPDMTEICGTAFSSAGELIATGTDGRIRIWDVRSQTLLAEIEDQYKQIRSLCFSADDIMLIAASGNADVRRWDVTDLEHPQELSPLRGHTAFVNQIALSPDGKTLASGGDDSTLRLWDPLSGEELVTLRAHSSIIQCLAWSPDGQTLYTGSGDATVRIWHAPSWEEIEAAEQADEDPDR